MSVINVIDLQAYRNRKYAERRKGIQGLTGMVGAPIFVEQVDLQKLIEPDNCHEHVFTENEIGY